LETKILSIKKLDFIAAFSLFLLSYIVYFLGCKELLAIGFYEQINIAFDLDQSWYFDFVARDTIDWQFKPATDVRPLAIKHPFIYLYHYIVIILNTVGISDNVSVIVISQAFHSGSLLVSFYIFRSMGRGTLDASLLTIGLAGTSAYISTGLVLDVYTVSIFWISLIFLIVSRHVNQNSECPIWMRAFISVMAIGTTSYLLILVFLMEYSLVKNKGSTYLKSFININLYKQLIRVFILGIILFIFVYFQTIIDIIQDPVGILKRTFWTVNRPGEKTGIFQVITVFTIFSIVSPKVSNIVLPEGITMIDLRLMEFNYIGWTVIAILAVSVVFRCKKNEHRFIMLFSLVWLIFNVLFHTIYQYRSSLFLYSGHYVLAVWIMYCLPYKLNEFDLEWKIYIHKVFDLIIIYLLPFVVWFNNIFLYKEILNII